MDLISILISAIICFTYFANANDLARGDFEFDI